MLQTAKESKNEEKIKSKKAKPNNKVDAKYWTREFDLVKKITVDGREAIIW